MEALMLKAEYLFDRAEELHSREKVSLVNQIIDLELFLEANDLFEIYYDPNMEIDDDS
jgi:hypothetical protein